MRHRAGVCLPNPGSDAGPDPSPLGSQAGTRHWHGEIEDLDLITNGTLTIRPWDEVEEVEPETAMWVTPQTVRSNRKEGGEPVEMQAISHSDNGFDSKKVDYFWGSLSRSGTAPTNKARFACQ